MAAEPVIEAINVGFTYRNPPMRALSEVTARIEPGSFTAVMGPNGSGKSTLARLIVGLLTPTEGTLRVMGASPANLHKPARQRIGYVPQHESVNEDLPLRAREIVALALTSYRRLTGARVNIAQRVHAALELVKMDDLADQQFAALSEGQRQRVLLARALAVDPHLLVLDEPCSRVDVPSRELLAELLTRLSREKSVTVLMVVHNVNVVAHSIDHVLLLRNRMVAFGTPEQVLTEENLRAAYGTSVPILVCEEGRLHPITETTIHG